MQMLLGALNDVDGMVAYGANGGGEQLLEQVNHKEVCGDWAEAMRGFEQALMMHDAEKEAAMVVDGEGVGGMGGGSGERGAGRGGERGGQGGEAAGRNSATSSKRACSGAFSTSTLLRWC